MRPPIGGVALTLAALVIVACADGATLLPAAQPTTLTIYAAASLRGALDLLKPAYESAHPGTTLVISTDSSAALETKIEHGAPVDVFLSADETNPQKLVDEGFAPGPITVFAGNELAIIVPLGNPAGVRSPADLAKPGLRLVAAADAVPITRYAGTLLENLASEPGYPAAFVAACNSNVVSREENVSAVVAKVVLGEGDAAIVYRTDAVASDAVQRIEIPQGAGVRARYAGVVIGASTSQLAAEQFLGWVAATEAQAILARLGFLPPTP